MRYELTQQMGRSLGRIWPRAASKLYEEPKKLVAAGLARAAAAAETAPDHADGGLGDLTGRIE